MSTRIEIINFKTIEKAVLEWDGYATVLGDNFIGKSGIAEAIDAALNNRPGTDFIRWGAKYSEVRIVREGLDLLWHKEPGNNYYFINGETYDKINNDIPTEIKKAGFGPFYVGKEVVDLNYSKQFKPLFLIDDKKKGYVTDLLASMYKIDTVYKADGLCKKDLRNVVSKLKIRTTDKKLSEEEFDNLSGFPKVVESVKSLGELRDALNKELKNLQSARGMVSTLQRSSNDCRRLKAVLDVVDVDSSPVLDLREAITDLRSWEKRISGCKDKILSLKKVSDISEVRSSPELISRMQEEIYKLGNLLGDLDAGEAEISSLSGIASVGDVVSTEVEDLRSSVRDMASLYRRMERAEESIKSLRGVADITAITIPESSYSEIEYMASLLGRFNKKALEVKSAKKELEDIEIDIEETNRILDEFDTCPLCGGEIHADH